ncbi:MAG TPA: hypothetical protein GX528_07410 [Firmicutes bacterium]|nr:hypothetical protein [Bacillota bacterium]
MEYLVTLVTASLAGFFARWYMLRRDYRQYPSYPQGWAVHLFLGFIGALIGAVIVPAFLEKEFAAVSFLLLAASQFREVRSVERDTLKAVESTEMVSRGDAYIEGIARVFEARNYLAIWVSLGVGITSEFFKGLGILRLSAAALVGLGLAHLLNRLMRGDLIGDVAGVELAQIKWEGPLLTIGDKIMTNVGLEKAREIYKKRGLAAVIKPKNPDAKATLANFGQMQAIAHDVASMVGIYMDVEEQEFTPLVRRDAATGSLYFVMLPSEANPEAFLAAIRRVPVLEGAIRKPLTSTAGRMLD